MVYSRPPRLQTQLIAFFVRTSHISPFFSYTCYSFSHLNFVVCFLTYFFFFFFGVEYRKFVRGYWKQQKLRVHGCLQVAQTQVICLFIHHLKNVIIESGKKHKLVVNFSSSSSSFVWHHSTRWTVIFIKLVKPIIKTEKEFYWSPTLYTPWI